MSTNKKLITQDVLDDDKLVAIEYHYENGDFAFQALWDPRDDHTEEKIKEFRAWCGTMATRLGYVVEE